MQQNWENQVTDYPQIKELKHLRCSTLASLQDFFKNIFTLKTFSRKKLQVFQT